MTIYPYAWVKLRSTFDLTTLNAKIQDLEQLSAQPEFWDNQEIAQTTLQELNELKSNVKQYRQWQNLVEETKAIAELLELEEDAALIEEAETNLTQLQQELDRWELQQLLSGTYDKKGAILTINAGAGGTDAQDWAEMLLRMYTRS